MTTERKARELLAVEAENAGWTRFATALRSGNADDTLDKIALRAITRALESAGQGEVQDALTEQQKADRDAVMYGTGFMLGGKHIPAHDVMVVQAPQQPEALSPGGTVEATRDEELPGLWSASDFTGGRDYEQPEAQAGGAVEPDCECVESDGCPTEGAVLKRFWRSHQPDPKLCEFYGVKTVAELLSAQEEHILKLQESARRNVKPWEDTFPPTLLPKYLRDSGLAAAEPATRTVIVHATTPPAKVPEVAWMDAVLEKWTAEDTDKPFLEYLHDAMLAAAPAPKEG